MLQLYFNFKKFFFNFSFNKLFVCECLSEHRFMQSPSRKIKSPSRFFISPLRFRNFIREVHCNYLKVSEYEVNVNMNQIECYSIYSSLK